MPQKGFRARSAPPVSPHYRHPDAANPHRFHGKAGDRENGVDSLSGNIADINTGIPAQ